MYLLKILILAITAIVLLTGCEVNDNTVRFKETIKDTHNRNKLPGAISGNGVSLGLYNTNGDIETDYCFNLNEGENFKKFIAIGNFIDNPREYKILIFDNFVQTNFSVDSNIEKNSFTLVINAKESQEVPISLNNLSKGFHDIIIMIVKYTDKKDLNEEFRKNTDIDHMLFIRFNIIVDNDNIPKFDYTSYETNKFDRLDGIFLNKDKDILKRWLIEDIDDDTPINYYIHVGNNRFDSRDYAIIVLDNWQQIPINSKSGNVVYIKLLKNEKTVIPGVINIIYQDGIHDLTAILVHNPFHKINMYNKTVESSIRVGINKN